jgi:small multidrug resistance pump
VFEVAGTLLLPLSNNFTKISPSAGLIVCYLISLYFLTFAIKTIPIAIVYATWAGLGVFLVAFLSYVFFSSTPVASDCWIILHCGWRNFGNFL